MSTVDNPLVSPKDLTPNLILVVIILIIGSFVVLLGVYGYQLSDPYVREVVSLQGDSAKGQAIFQTNCTGCHGWEANGGVGPSLHNVSQHKSRISLIHQVTTGKTPPMPKFTPNSQEMADLLSYLETL